MGMTAVLPSAHRVRLSTTPRPRLLPPLSWERLVGRLTELSQPRAWGALTLLAGLVREAQLRGEAVAWVAAGATVFHPGDFGFRGIDLGGLTVVRPPKGGAPEAADLLSRSGAFGLVVVDGWEGPADEGMLGRLARLAETRQLALVVVTRKPASAPGLGAQVSLRIGLERRPRGARVTVLRDKRAGADTAVEEAFDGPLGLY